MKFDYELSDNIKELKKKEDSFLKYMKRKKKSASDILENVAYVFSGSVCLMRMILRCIRNMKPEYMQMLKSFGQENITKK